MATRTPSTIALKNAHARSVKWEGLLNGDDGTPVEFHQSPDRSVQITGTFGVGGSVSVKGSNDGTNYVILTDPQGNALTFTAAGLEAVSELTQYIKPHVTAGDGSTDLKCYLFAAGGLP